MTADVKMSEIAEVELTHSRIVASSADTVRRCFREISEGGRSEEIYEMKGAGRSIRGIAGELGIARNTVRRYLKSPEAIRAKSRPHQASKLDQYTGYIDRRLHEGLENCVVLHRELRALGYDGGYSILKDYVSPRRRPRQPDATMRFETAPGEQAQVDWGSLAYWDILQARDTKGFSKGRAEDNNYRKWYNHRGQPSLHGGITPNLGTVATGILLGYGERNKTPVITGVSHLGPPRLNRKSTLTPTIKDYSATASPSSLILQLSKK